MGFSPSKSFVKDLATKVAPVVVLIDEYDKPIIEHVEDLPTAILFRKFMKGFYGCLKSQGHFTKFLLLTGVSKFSQVSIFSELNHLSDLTMSHRAADLLGYTQQELETCFGTWIDTTAKKMGSKRDILLDDIRRWYNGYRFSRINMKVYNPFSTLRFFEEQAFSNFWFESGTPSFLPKLMKSKDYDGAKVDNLKIASVGFSAYEIESLEIPALLFQTGYLTIKDFEEMDTYTLGYPNYEVESSFVRYLASIYAEANPGEMTETVFSEISCPSQT